MKILHVYVFCRWQKLLNCELILDDCFTTLFAITFLEKQKLVTQIMGKEVEKLGLIIFWPSEIVP